MAIIVKADPGETANQVIRKFKKKVQLDQILTDIREREFYKKPSEIKKEKLAEKRKRKKRKTKSWQKK
jgi:small subunit ribosomal protein S21